MDTITTILGPAATAPVDSSTPGGPDPLAASSGSSHRLSKGEIAAIAVIVALVVLAIAFLVVQIARRRYNSRMPRVRAEDITPIPGYPTGIFQPPSRAEPRPCDEKN
jgi:hypothetical protein